jgi:hypothetical protein
MTPCVIGVRLGPDLRNARVTLKTAQEFVRLQIKRD